MAVAGRERGRHERRLLKETAMLHTYDDVHDESLRRPDPHDHLHELEHWSPLTARQIARDEGIEELSEAHWHVIHALRNLYRERGGSASAREVIHLLEQDFADEGGRRYLYELFPKGPVNQGSRIAGVPVPPYSSDLSFGWAG
jgi:tRNA 2-thiouridine synthesizing protein E